MLPRRRTAEDEKKAEADGVYRQTLVEYMACSWACRPCRSWLSAALVFALLPVAAAVGVVVSGVVAAVIRVVVTSVLAAVIRVVAASVPSAVMLFVMPSVVAA